MELPVIGSLLVLVGMVTVGVVIWLGQRITKQELKAEQQWQAQREAADKYIEARAREYYQRLDSSRRVQARP